MPYFIRIYCHWDIRNGLKAGSEKHLGSILYCARPRDLIHFHDMGVCISAWRIGVVGLLAILAAPLAAQHESTLSLAPSKNWSVDFADDSCVVRRLFSNGENSVLLEFRSYGPGPTVDVRVLSDNLPARVRKPSTRFEPSGEAQPHKFYLTLKADGGWHGVFYSEKLPANEAAIADYDVRGVFRSDVELMTGPLADVMKVMRSCEDDLLVSLGLDPAANRNLSRRVDLNWDEKWLSVTAPMQRDSIRKGSMFQEVRLLVDKQGKAFGCRVVQGSVDADISKRMCDALLAHAQFKPALDAQAQPVKSYFILALSEATGSYTAF